MTFVTKLSLESGDRAVLEETVTEIKEFLARKGAECRGPFNDPPERLSVPQYRNLTPGDRFSAWNYSVYARRLEIHGNDHIARQIGHRDFPQSLHVEIEVEQRKPAGHRRS
ncbi:uS10/mL48 family ribosomal protein [Salinigranum halophilum]|jgi:ribosomal protein S10|uniref:uS10/mL48 family ribosomal protein n=1 Tax=Salinigranum halophilum TaxID=2565931 RepID=UPI0010A85826|nr:uS10/mL48 family ribosomal protein [Salinigranum halophilum]